MNIPFGARTRGDADGFLVNIVHAHSFRRGAVLPRVCRWCGSQLRWRGSMLCCDGSTLGLSCDWIPDVPDATF